MLSKSSATKLAGDLFEQYKAERTVLDEYDKFARGKHPEPWKPKTANKEYRELEQRSVTPLFSLILSSLSQSCFVDGFGARDESDESPAWRIWQANGWDARQIPLHRGAFALGQSFVKVMPGMLPDGKRMPVARGVSARSMYAVYQDPAEDEWPMYGLEVKPSGRDSLLLHLYDEEVVHRLSIEGKTGAPTYIDFIPHEMPEVPIVRVPNTLDLDGRVVGEVEPFIPVVMRIDQTTFDRLMVQRYASWKVRYVAGMAKPESEAEKNAQKLRLAQDDILVAANKDTKFGTLPETSLDGFDRARDSDLMLLSVVSQLPPQYFGQVTNLSADALAMAESSLMRKIGERQTTLGEAHEQWLRLAAGWLGFEVPHDAQVKWRDVESRSLAQVADALGKIAAQLKFPAEVLWDKIPGLTQSDIAEAKRIVEEGSAVQRLFDELDRKGDGPDRDVA